MAPYQERPQVHPLELILHIDPAKDRQRIFPLLMAVGSSKDAATNSALEKKISELNERLPDAILSDWADVNFACHSGNVQRVLIRLEK